MITAEDRRYLELHKDCDPRSCLAKNQILRAIGMVRRPSRKAKPAPKRRLRP